MPVETDGVSLDPTRLLGFRDVAKVAAGDETPKVEELSRVLSKIGAEQPPPVLQATQSE
jgi:hypothetical protein